MEKMLEQLFRNIIASMGYTPEDLRELVAVSSQQISSSAERIKAMDERLSNIERLLAEKSARDDIGTRTIASANGKETSTNDAQERRN